LVVWLYWRRYRSRCFGVEGRRTAEAATPKKQAKQQTDNREGDHAVSSALFGKEATMESGGWRPNLVKMSDEDLRLDEPWQDIRELDVYDIDGEQIGSVEDLYVERETRLPRFLDVSAGGFLGIGKKHFLVPVEEVSRDVSEERVTVNRYRQKVLDSPEFDPDEMPRQDLQHAIFAYYGHSW
jgi:sporulation protein YlmC with PRC-barrel domain